MKNFWLQWVAFLIVPWLTLFFMKKEDRKRFFPLAMFSALTSVMIHEAGNQLGWWKQLDSNYPFGLPFYLVGLSPVVTMWIFKFTYKKFWLFVAVDAVLNLGFNFLFFGFLLVKMGMREPGNISPIVVFLITTIHGLILYVYQMWQEGVFRHPYREVGEKQ